ncbi:MAG: hypothetical protein ACRYFU_07075 [Janthinobacterium lividum]
MQSEQTPPNQPKFLLVVYMFAGAIVVIVLAAIIIIGWRNRKGHKTPYTKTPVSWVAPAPRLPHPYPASTPGFTGANQAV